MQWRRGALNFRGADLRLNAGNQLSHFLPLLAALSSSVMVVLALSSWEMTYGWSQYMPFVSQPWRSVTSRYPIQAADAFLHSVVLSSGISGTAGSFFLMSLPAKTRSSMVVSKLSMTLWFILSIYLASNLISAMSSSSEAIEDSFWTWDAPTHRSLSIISLTNALVSLASITVHSKFPSHPPKHVNITIAHIGSGRISSRNLRD